MRQILLALATLFACTLALVAQNPHITNAIPFGASSLKIVFSSDIDSLTLTPIKLNQNSYYVDIKAVLDIGRKVYFFPRNAQVTIAQNTPEIVRIVITNGNNTNYQLKQMQKNLYLSFVDSTQSAQTTQTAQTTQNKPPANQTTQTPPTQPKPTQPQNAQNATANKDDKSTQNQKKDSAKQESKKTPKTQKKENPKKEAKKQETQKKDSTKSKKDSAKNKPPAKNTKTTKSTPPTPRTIVSTMLATPSSRQGIKVVIDPGHGGVDCGTLGVTKVCEKHIVLKIALKVHNELKKRGYESYLTRDRDIFIKLPERTKFANDKKADLFISIHANSVPKGKTSPRGIETYFLSAARSEDARNVADQENKADTETMAKYQKLQFLNTLETHRIIASNRLAIDIQAGIKQNLQANYPPSTIIDNGVREGPFWVLVGALMPSVLVEVGYNSHPLESQRLNDDSYQRVLSIGIADGIDSFVAKNFK